MKKLFAIILSLVFVLYVSACDTKLDGNADTDKASQNSTVSESSLNSATVSESTNPSVSQDVSSEVLITREKAIKITLDHAGFKENEVINLTAELDRDFSHTEWEVDFENGGYEYSYDINAADGSIIKNTKEVD
ncbi:MAG: PepSY domain-containing protein [Clostridia bacterium]|nr:PepSY domain-containing protein [Clostridia bacterium]